MTKYKIIKDYQLTTEDKKIILLKAKVLIIDYVYSTKDITVTLDPLLVDGNPEYFQFIDMKTDFVNFLKINKIPQPSVVAKKIFPYIVENFKTNDSVSEVVSDGDYITLINDNHKNAIEKINKEHQFEIDELKKLNNITTTEAADVQIELSNEIESLKKIIVEKTKAIDIIEKNYISQISKLELEQSNLNIKKSEYSQNIEEEMISKLKEVNERLEAVIKREGEVRANEMISTNALVDAHELNAKNALIATEIEIRERALDIKLNELNAKEKHLESFDRNKIIEDAIKDYEKSIPWQYHRK